MRGITLIVLLCCGILTSSGNSPKDLNVYRGSTPVLDGFISSGEYDDATCFTGTADWFHYGGDPLNFQDISVEAWVKHDGQNLYFAFKVTDDVIYGIDIPRWVPGDNQDVHLFDPAKGWPWFGDGIEIFLNPRNNADISKVTGRNAWIVACSTHKSYLDSLNGGGLIDGEPKNHFAWNIYREWIKSGAMKAAVRINSENEGKGYVIEWKIAANPCMEIENGDYWNPGSGVTKMGINFEIQDLDEKEKGSGNFANMHHIEVWGSEKHGDAYSKIWGTLILNPGPKPWSRQPRASDTALKHDGM